MHLAISENILPLQEIDTAKKVHLQTHDRMKRNIITLTKTLLHSYKYDMSTATKREREREKESD